MSAFGLSRIATSGETGMLLPQRKAPRLTATTRTCSGEAGGSSRTSVCQNVPAELSTSTRPYNTEPALSGSASSKISSGRLRADMAATAWHERTEIGKKAAYARGCRFLSLRLVNPCKPQRSTHMSIQKAPRPNDTLNGFDTLVMGQTIEAIQRDRALARFEFRA